MKYLSISLAFLLSVSNIFSAIDLAGENLSGENFYRCVLYRAYLSHTTWYRARLGKTEFELADLTRANLYLAEFDNTLFLKAKLIEAKLFETDLKDSNFTGADLSKADLHDSNVSKCNFTNANLSGANLKGTIFFVKKDDEIKEGAIVENANFKGALLDRKVIPYLIEHGAINVVPLEE